MKRKTADITDRDDWLFYALNYHQLDYKIVKWPKSLKRWAQRARRRNNQAAVKHRLSLGYKSAKQMANYPPPNDWD